MYDKLVEALRICAVDGLCKTCPRFSICDDEEGPVLAGLLNDAADVIEELSKQIEAVQCVNICDLDCDSNQVAKRNGRSRRRREV